jgi:YfiH family protein
VPVAFRFGAAADGDLAIDADPAGLADRRAAICAHPWTWLRQVHGARVVVVSHPAEHAGAAADAAVTTVPGACVAVHTADCAPVLLASADGGVVGAAHAGWRGLYEGVLEATVAAMRELSATGVTARLGPCISPAAYEFGHAELTTLALRFGPTVVAATTGGAPAFDLRAGVRQALRDVDVPLDESAVACTALDAGWFSWRARRDAARQASVTWIEP